MREISANAWYKETAGEAWPDALAWHRSYYRVSARNGHKIIADGRPATIVGASGPHLWVRFDDDLARGAVHPTWHVDYLDGKGVRV